MRKGSTRRRALEMLALGALAGVLLGAGAALRQRALEARAMPSGAIATVNGRVIRQAEYARVLEAIASDRRGELSQSDRKMALDRLIEQELLIQYGVARGMVEADRAVREAIVREMIASVTADAASEQPSEDQLRAFYSANRTDFTGVVARASQRTDANPYTLESGFEDLRPTVKEEYRQRSEGKALRDYLGWLRANAKIVTARELPK